MQRMISAVLLLITLSACSNTAVDKAAGDGPGTGIAVRRSDAAVVVENHTGRPLLNVRATIETDAGATFIQVLPSLGTGEAADLPLANCRSEDGTLFELSMAHPTRVTVTARDTLANQHDAAVAW